MRLKAETPARASAAGTSSSPILPTSRTTFARHLARHLADAQRWDDLASLLESPALDTLGSWIHHGVTDQGVVCLSGLIAHLRRTRRGTTAAGFATQLARINRGSADTMRPKRRSEPRWTTRRSGPAAAQVPSRFTTRSLSLYRQHYEQAEMFYVARCGDVSGDCLDTRTRLEPTCSASPPVNQEQARYRRGARRCRAARQICRKLATCRTNWRPFASRRCRSADSASTTPLTATISSALALIQQSTGVDHELPRVDNVRGWLAYDRCTITGAGLDESIACFPQRSARCPVISQLLHPGRSDVEPGVVLDRLDARDRSRRPARVPEVSIGAGHSLSACGAASMCSKL